MRRLTLRAGLASAVLAAATGLTGCSNFRDLFSAHADVAAEVRRTVPLSLRLLRLGGEAIVPALVRALRRASSSGPAT